MKIDERVRAFNASKGRCAVCAAPLAFVEFGNRDVETGWGLFQGADTSSAALCARCLRLAHSSSGRDEDRSA